jgi:anti-anti-sigma factor
MGDPAVPRFTVSGARLTVTGDLRSGDEAEFAEALSALVSTGERQLTVDLSGVRYVSSSYVRHVATAVMQARQEGGHVRILASRRAVRLLRMGGLDKVCTVEEAGG